MNDTSIKYERMTVTIPSGTVAKIHPLFKKVLDQNFKQCIGVGFSEISDGGVTRYDIGVKDRDGKRDLIDLHDKQFFVIAPAANVNERFRSDIQFPVTAESIGIQIETMATLTADLVIQVVFKLQA